jgi:hypothetical protein
VRGDLEKVHIVVYNWEAEVGTVRADNRELRTWLQEAQAQQSQAEETARAAEQKAKEADELKATLDAKVAALVTAEEQLRQERAARQEAEGQLKQERTALADARSALEQERTARETTQKSLEERDADVSRLDGELIALSIANADQERSLEEQGATVVSLQQAVEAERRALEVEKKQVEGKLLFRFCFADLPFEGSFPFSFLLLVTFRPTHRPGARVQSGRDVAGRLQLLRAGAGGAACCSPRDLPGRRRGRGASWKLVG